VILLRLPFRFLRVLMQSTFLALGQIWANKVRSVLTTIGIVIGVASVTTVIAVLTGLKSNVLSEFEAFGTNKIFLIPRRPDEGRLRHASWRTIRFTPDQLEGLTAHCPSVDQYTPVADFVETLRYGHRTAENVHVLGIAASWHKIESRPVQLGRPFTAIDDAQARPVCLVTPKVRDKLRLDRDCVGQSVLVGKRWFRIVGVVEPHLQSAMFGGGGSDLEICIPFSTLWDMRQPGMHVVATSKSAEVSDEARAEIRFFLRRVRNLQPGDPDTFQVEVLEKYLEQFRNIALAITIVAGGIVGISLLVGGVGIMNIMLVSVSERTREIGLRKAVGARPSAILMQFLVEAVMLCFFGGAMGVFLGQALTSAMASIPGAKLDKAQIPLWAVAVSFGFAAAVGVFFGMFPAIKAARLDPIEALRHE
jgi:putative ABC transport system permease protein